MNHEKDRIQVSICCMTYNQEDYIAEAIDSFLKQEANFKYEILVHDDASTDRTPLIIEQYVEKYPGVIIPILQKENQTSKGKFVSQILHNNAHGKYIALCEGDDFFTDPSKIQRQYDYMESHPECSMCIHDAHFISEDKSIEFKSPFISKKEKNFNSVDAIRGLGVKAATNSFFYRTEFVKGNLPKYFQIAPTGDYPRVVQLSLNGYIHYSPRKMCAHRIQAKGSFSRDLASSPNAKEKRKVLMTRQCAMLDVFDCYTMKKYHQIIEEEKQWEIYNLAFSNRDLDTLKREPYKTMLSQESIKRKIQFYYPNLFGAIQNVHRFGLGLAMRIKKSI